MRLLEHILSERDPDSLICCLTSDANSSKNSIGQSLYKDCIEINLRINYIVMSCWLVEKDPSTPFNRSKAYSQKAYTGPWSLMQSVR